MKKILSILFISIFVLVLVSCNTKTGAEKDFENMKDSINESIGKAGDKTKDGVDNMKDSWNDTKDAIDEKADTIKANVKKDVQKKLD